MNRDSTRAARSLRDRAKQAVREAILQSAEAAFAEFGLAQAPMEEIAARAGVAVGTLYNYFAGRSELVDAVFERGYAELDGRLGEKVSAGLDFEASVRALVRETFGHFADHAPFFALVLQDDRLVTRRPGHGAGIRVVLGHAVRLFQRAARAGLIPAKLAALQAELATGCIRAALIHMLGRSPTPTARQWSAAVDRVASFIVRGVGPSGS